ncbi:hypothetical protein [Hoeflea sp. TYP-13]|uniref:hypothetical protein n=1 Tax=Hoeflea sp. TYP-13 TaxID=3230023 RepID=UPI0034C62002
MYRLSALFGAVLLALSPGLALAQQGGQPVPVMPTPAYEYVQQASSMQYDGTTLTLQGVAPSTIFFSDRPYRLTGQVATGMFADLWNSPDGPFASDPPNAAISVLGKTDEAPAIVELTSAKVDGTSVQYGVKVLSGKLPESAENVAMFVDHGPRLQNHPASGHPVGYYPYHPYHPYHPVPGPYCYHAPQDPECHYHPYHPYPPYPPPYHPYYYPGAAFAAGAVVGAAAASSNQPQQTYIYPIPAGPIPAHCYINSNHTRMICSVPIN